MFLFYPDMGSCTIRWDRLHCPSLDYDGRVKIAGGAEDCQVHCLKDINCKRFVFFANQGECAIGPQTCSDGKPLLEVFSEYDMPNVVTGFKSCSDKRGKITS